MSTRLDFSLDPEDEQDRELKNVRRNNIKQIEFMARKGDPYACYLLGEFNLNGNRTVSRPNLKRAIYWFKLSADGGYVRGQFMAGWVSTTRFNVPDVDACLKYYLMCSKNERNCSWKRAALFNLSFLFRDGIVGGGRNFKMETDYEKSVGFLKQAINLGHVGALRELALYYLHGIHSAKDVVTAKVLFQLGANKGDATSMYYLAKIYIKRGTHEDCQIRMNLYRARYLLRKARKIFVKYSMKGDIAECDLYLKIVHKVGIEGNRQEQKDLKFEIHACANCQKGDSDSQKLQMCSRCKHSRYCSTKCQQIHWAVHKSECRKTSTVRVNDFVMIGCVDSLLNNTEMKIVFRPRNPVTIHGNSKILSQFVTTNYMIKVKRTDLKYVKFRYNVRPIWDQGINFGNYPLYSSCNRCPGCLQTVEELGVLVAQNLSMLIGLREMISGTISIDTIDRDFPRIFHLKCLKKITDGKYPIGKLKKEKNLMKIWELSEEDVCYIGENKMKNKVLSVLGIVLPESS